MHFLELELSALFVSTSQTLLPTCASVYSCQITLLGNLEAKQFINFLLEVHLNIYLPRSGINCIQVNSQILNLKFFVNDRVKYKIHKFVIQGLNAEQNKCPASNRTPSQRILHETHTWVENVILNAKTRNLDSTRGTFISSRKNWNDHNEVSQKTGQKEKGTPLPPTPQKIIRQEQNFWCPKFNHVQSR